MGLPALEAKGTERQRGLPALRDKRLRRDIQKLEQDLDVDQTGSLLHRAADKILGNPFVATALDIISRPNYSVAGAFEELAMGKGFGSAAGRAGREMFSGAFGLQGDKQGFGGVLKDMGVGAGPSLSDVAPFAFSKTGEGAAFKRGGFFDWTARGVTGLALDIVLDPLTYLTFGAAPTARGAVKAGTHYLSAAGKKSLAAEVARGLEAGMSHGAADTAARAAIAGKIEKGAKHLADQGGIKMFGRTIVPGEVINGPSRTARDGVVKVLHRSSMGETVIKVGESLGKVFDRDYVVRNQPKYVARKQLYITEKDEAHRAWREYVAQLHKGTSKKQRAALSHVREGGGAVPLPSDMPGAKHIMNQLEKKYGEMAATEQAMGLLQDTIPNYVYHAYKESPERVREVFSRDPRLRATLKGSQKHRVISTIELAKSLGLTPIEDSAELLLRRGFRHIEATHTKRFFEDVIQEFGERALPDELEAGAHVIAETNKIAELLDADELAKVTKASRPGVPIDEVRALSPQGRELFLAQRFSRVQSKLEMERTINKYREFDELFPKTTDQSIQQLPTFNGEPMVKIADISDFKDVYLPKDIAKDIADFNKSFINREEVAGLLKVYDKFMNGWKVGVTSIWFAFHFRNAYSNLVQQFTDVGISALNPAMHIDAVRMLAGDVKGSFVAAHGRRWGYREVVYEAKRRGVLSDYRNVFETFGDKIPIRVSGPLDYIRHPVDSAKRMGGLIENESRLTLFTNYLRRGLDPETAAERVNKILFDYKKLSKVERDVLARMFPFYRWTRKNIALQAERLVKNPQQAATQAKLTRENRTSPELLPSYLRGDFVFTLDADERGNVKYIRGLDLPITDLNILGEPGRAMLSNIAPIPKMVMELSLDHDFFRGKPITENSRPLIKQIGASLDALPQRVKNKIDFSKTVLKDGTVEYRVNPVLAYVAIKSWAISRLYGTADRVLRSQSIFSAENFLDLGTGIRLQDVDIDTAARTLAYEYKDALETEAIAKGKRRRFTSTFKPKDRK